MKARKVLKYLGWMLVAGPAYGQSVQVVTGSPVACGEIQVAFADLPPSTSVHGHWLTIAEAGSPNSVNTYRFQYLPARSTGASGVARFSTRGLIPFKPYEVRFHLDWDLTHSYDVAASDAFGVMPRPNCRPAMITRIEPTTMPDQPLGFSFQGLRNVRSNWAALALPGANNPVFKKSVILAGGSGQATIDTTDLAAGTYELRLFEDWDGTHEYFIHARQTVVLP